MRKYLRNIAKARLKAMGVQHVNKNLGNGLKSINKKHFRNSRRRRAMIALYRKYHQGLWREVLFGRLAWDGYKAQMNINTNSLPWLRKAFAGIRRARS